MAVNFCLCKLLLKRRLDCEFLQGILGKNCHFYAFVNQNLIEFLALQIHCIAKF